MSSSLSTMWPCSSDSHEGLVTNLRNAGLIQSAPVFEAMKATDRAKYLVPLEQQRVDDDPFNGGGTTLLLPPFGAYQNTPHPIGFHQTMSAPHMHAHALELAYATIKDVDAPRILDVGAGSGYLTACLGRLVQMQGRGGKVFGLERIAGLVQMARKHLENADGDLVASQTVSIHVGNGWDGLPNEAPFHFIHVGAAADLPPQALMDQLVDHGRLVLALEEPRGGQSLVEIQRTGNSFSQRHLMGVCYVPLVRHRKSSVDRVYAP